MELVTWRHLANSILLDLSYQPANNEEKEEKQLTGINQYLFNKLIPGHDLRMCMKRWELASRRHLANSILLEWSNQPANNEEKEEERLTGINQFNWNDDSWDTTSKCALRDGVVDQTTPRR